MAAAAHAEPTRDHALWFILASNLLTLLVALLFHWDVRELLWPYWLQSVVIGAFAARRMSVLRRFAVEGFSINDKPATETPETRRSTVTFFIVHYGFFHLGYLVFLWTGWKQSGAASTSLDWLAIGLVAMSFVWSHWSSHREHVEADLAGRPNLGKLMFMPYLRVIPMHMVILFGAARGGAVGTLLLFVILKTLADLGMHRFEHSRLQRGLRSTRE
jgi:hypothetical protein